MAQRGKNLDNARNQLDKANKYELREALSLVQEMAFAKFDETIDMAVRLGVNPRHADQVVRHVETIEPDLAQLGQHAALVGDRVGQDPVEGTDPIGTDQ